MFNDEKSGTHGTTLLDGHKLPIKVWEVAPTDKSIAGGYGHQPSPDFPLYNVSLSILVKQLGPEVSRILAKPVDRQFADGRVQMLPDIFFIDTKLFHKEGDQRPTVEFDKLKVVVGPMVSVGMLVQTSYNLTRPREDPLSHEALTKGQEMQRKNAKPLTWDKIWRKTVDGKPSDTEYVALETVVVEKNPPSGLSENMLGVTWSGGHLPKHLQRKVPKSDSTAVRELTNDAAKWANEQGMS